MTSPNIRYFERMAFNYGLLAAVGAMFTVVHAFLGIWILFWIGLGVTVGSMYVAMCAAQELDAQKEITKAIETGRREKVSTLYGKEEN